MKCSLRSKRKTFTVRLVNASSLLLSDEELRNHNLYKQTEGGREEGRKVSIFSGF
jgi:hypothetical protein